MFENIIDQSAVSQLRDDILGGRLAPASLFYGPGESGKGSSALELARVLSCEEEASWKCPCPSCARHRYLAHEDLLAFGKKSFAAEINACCSIFTSNPDSQSAKLLFYRSLRKSRSRFSPVLMEDDARFAKVSSVLMSFDEKLDEFLQADNASLVKLSRALAKDALFLEEEGIGSVIPAGQVRRSAYWCRLAPLGKRKTLIIENADNMREEGRASLLKLLEEPPANVTIILTASRRESIMPTILSRLRPYRFIKRSPESEKEVLRRVFQFTQDLESAEKQMSEERSNGLIGAYLDSFLPGSAEKLYPLAAWFLVSVARIASLSIKKESGADIPGYLTVLGERYAPIAEQAGFERTFKSEGLAKALLAKGGNFEGDSFPRFLKLVLDMAAAAAREVNDPQVSFYNDVFRKYITEAVTAVETLNQSGALALEALLYKLKKALPRGRCG